MPVQPCHAPVVATLLQCVRQGPMVPDALGHVVIAIATRIAITSQGPAPVSAQQGTKSPKMAVMKVNNNNDDNNNSNR